MEIPDYSNYLPEDVLRDIEEAERELKQPTQKRKKPYPSSRDVAEAVVEAIRTFEGHPDEFPDYVLRLLRAKGFEVRHVTVKRIWRTYENLVRRGVIGDKLGVIHSS
jgi:hypothetical protein